MAVVGEQKCKQTNWRASSSTDGKLKMWVYGVAAGAFVLLIFIVSMIYLAWWVDQFNSPLFIIVPIHETPPHFPPSRFEVTHTPTPPFLSLFFYLFPFIFASFMSSSCESSSYCAKVHRSLKAQESDANGTVVWMGQNAHEMSYTCPDCQELAQTSSSS